MKHLTDEELITAVEMILSPGEYGLGTEVGSFAEDDKAAWENLGTLWQEVKRRWVPGFEAPHPASSLLEDL